MVQDAAGAVQVCNPAAERILGLTAGQMMGRTSLDPQWRAIRQDGEVFPGDRHPAMRALHTGEAQRDVLMGIYRPDDTLAWISINASPMFHAGEARPHSVVVTFADVTERKQSDDARARLAAIVDASRDAISAHDAGRHHCQLEPGAEQVYGYSAAEIVGNTPPSWPGRGSQARCPTRSEAAARRGRAAD